MATFNKLLLTIIAFGYFSTAFAHQEFWVTKNFGNVQVRIKTGFDYEEINKVFLFGVLAQKMAQQMKYSEPIFLDFNHHYIKKCNPDYFIAYDKGKIKYDWNKADEDKDFLEKDAIVVRQVAKQFDAKTTLKLLEYAILNIEKIKTSQNEIIYKKNYCDWRINTIDTALIQSIPKGRNSNGLDSILQLKTKRYDDTLKTGISYFFQNNKYVVHLKCENKPDSVLISLDNIYDFRKIDNDNFLIFDTEASFYYIKGSSWHCFSEDVRFTKLLSKRQIIQDIDKIYRPFKIGNVDGSKLSLSSWSYSLPKPRTLLYDIKNDQLYQDLDKLLKIKN